MAKDKTAGIVVWVGLARRVRALERWIDDVAREAELARRTADQVFQLLAAKDAASAAVVDVTGCQYARDAIREMICQAEAAQRAYGSDVPQ